MADPARTTPGRWQPRQRPPRPLLRAMIGEVLRRTRQAQGRTLADVARAARVSVPYLSELERGRKEASSEVLAAVCDALRIGLPGLLAELGRELTPAPGVRGGPARIIRLGSTDGARVSRPVPRSGDVQCLLAA
jgi:hypothetical protein